MPNQDQCLFQRLQGGAVTNIITSHQFTFNSSQLPGIEAQTTAVTSSLAGVTAQLNTLSGVFNDLKGKLINLGILAST